MNYSAIRNIIGKILVLSGILMLFPLAVSFIYQESLQHKLAYVIPICCAILLGKVLSFKKTKSMKIQAREGFVIVGCTWIVMSLVGCLPLLLSGEFTNFFDAFFEIVSGFTTTGASTVTDVYQISNSILFWRSFAHWIGGMGVLVFILAIIPESKDGSSMHILRAESPGPQVGKLVSKMRVTSRILYIIYFTLTVILVLFLYFGQKVFAPEDNQMNLFQVIVYSLGTAGTGGLAIDPYSLEYYSSFAQYTIGAFMFIFGINFQLYYFLLIGNIKDILKNEELRSYILIVIVAILIIFFNVLSLYNTYEEAFRHSFFQVGTIISTTGYSTQNFVEWPTLSKFVIIFLMFTGACAGSTAGGMKICRFNVLFKSTIRKIKNMLSPRKVEVIKVDGNVVNEDYIEGVQEFFIVYIFIWLVCAFLISFDNFGDIETNLTASLACISNIGPGLAKVGPYGGYAGYSNFSKFILSIEMIAGRLELFPILIMFAPKTWRKRIA